MTRLQETTIRCPFPPEHAALILGCRRPIEPTEADVVARCSRAPVARSLGTQGITRPLTPLVLDVLDSEQTGEVSAILGCSAAPEPEQPLHIDVRVARAPRLGKLWLALGALVRRGLFRDRPGAEQVRGLDLLAGPGGAPRPSV